MSKEIVCDSCGHIIRAGSGLHRVKVNSWTLGWTDGWWIATWRHLCDKCWEAHRHLVKQWDMGDN